MKQARREWVADIERGDEEAVENARDTLRTWAETFNNGQLAHLIDFAMSEANKNYEQQINGDL